MEKQKSVDCQIARDVADKLLAIVGPFIDHWWWYLAHEDVQKLPSTHQLSLLEFDNRNQLQGVDHPKFSHERLALKIMVLLMLSLHYVSAYINYNTFVNLSFLTIKRGCWKSKKSFFNSLKLVKSKSLLNQPTKRPWEPLEGLINLSLVDFFIGC